MKLYNLKDHNEQVSFAQAVTQGLGKNQGLFFPHDLPEFSLTEIDEMLILARASAAKNFAEIPRKVRIPSPTTEIMASRSVTASGSSKPSFRSR